MELVIMIVIAVFVLSYRNQNGENVYKFMSGTVSSVYNKYAPYSYEQVKEQSKLMGIDYSARKYLTDIVTMGGLFAAIGYIYFYSIMWAAIYAFIAIMFVPYLSFLKNKKAYSEFLFEQIQVYTSNVINEFNTTQSFVKALEGVRDSGILEDPVLTDVTIMINTAYQNGTIDEAILAFNKKYPYYMVKNMHQLFMQITKEGAKDSGESLENMMLDIDALVEGVYRDKMDRESSHKKFIGFGVALYFLVFIVQFLMGDTYKEKMLDLIYVKILLHGVIWVNTFFILTGEKFYNEDTGVE